MANLARLIAFVLFSAWSLSAWSFGAIPGKTAIQYQCYTASSSFYGWGENGPASCADFVAKSPPYIQKGVRVEETFQVTTSLGACDIPRSQCQIKTKSISLWNGVPTGAVNDGLVTASYRQAGAPSFFCPENATKVGTASCECNEGFKNQGGTCVPYSCPAPGNYTSMTQPDQAVPNAGDGICMGGCSYTPSSWKGGQDGTIWAAWPFKSTGKACGGNKGTDGTTTGEKNTDKPAPIPCGANQCPGSATMNGVTTQMCVACKGTTAPPSTDAASAPAGSASGTGDTTTTKQTSCDGVNCTTTTTTRDGSGNVTGSTKSEQPQEDFCSKNANSPLCKKSSFGGSCAATSCEGDAVQCALAQEVIKRNCQWYDDQNETKPQQDVGKAAIAAGDQPDWHPAKHAEESSLAGSIDQSDALGGGSCPADVVVPGPFGTSLAVPFSKVCEPAGLLGNALVALAMLAAALIMFKGN